MHGEFKIGVSDYDFHDGFDGGFGDGFDDGFGGGFHHDWYELRR